MKALIFTFLLFPLSLLAQLNASLSMDVSICEGSSGASMTFTGSNGTEPYTFTYNINGGIPQMVTTTVGSSVSVSVSTVTAGTFNYQLTQVSDDLGANQAVTDNAFAFVNPLPIVNAGPDQMVCPGTSVTLTGSGAATYSWNNGVTNGVAFVPPATNTYTVTGTNMYGCINTDQVLVTVDCSSIDEMELFSVQIFPNPAESILNIESEVLIESVQIFNSIGQLVIESTPLLQETSIDLNGLQEGIYLVKLKSQNGMVVKRIVVH